MLLSKNEMISFDSLRAIASILVLFSHCWQILLISYYPEYHRYIALFSQGSVMLFFAMSGFLIACSIQENILKNNNFSLSQYAISRLIRIYPPLILSVVLVIFLFAFARYSHLFSENALKDTYFLTYISDVSKEKMSALTFGNGLWVKGITINRPLWSLPYEVWCYILVGIIFINRKICYLLAIMLFGLLCLVTKSNNMFLYYSGVWFSGFGVAYLHKFTYKNKSILFDILFTILFLISFYFFILNVNLMISKGANPSNVLKYNTTTGFFFSFCFLFLLRIKKLKIKN